ncbi:hypothetical protein PROFUN_03661 [Planoprotostelium fungivorum]|uniref:Uncharacterized protein n=1 Tax=Planoprotostelium fungivorum TaxID=1890364 RepID=A0A2P6NSG7_9EUKA|nr:hypothetical protein PROFUN_03661 [Planoprotostelium fungivorum]
MDHKEGKDTGHGKMISPDSLGEKEEWQKIIDSLSDKGVRVADLSRGLKNLRHTLLPRNRIEADADKVKHPFKDACEQKQMTKQFYDHLFRRSYSGLASLLLRISQSNPIRDVMMVCQGDLSVVQLLVYNGAHINCTDANGWTPLMHAIEEMQSDICHLFVNHSKINLHHKNIDGNTALHLLAKINDSSFVEQIFLQMLGRNVTVDIRNNQEHLGVVELLLQSGADPSLKTESGHTPHSWATQLNNAALVNLLPENATAKPFSLHSALDQKIPTDDSGNTSNDSRLRWRDFIGWNSASTPRRLIRQRIFNGSGRGCTNPDNAGMQLVFNQGDCGSIQLNNPFYCRAHPPNAKDVTDVSMGGSWPLCIATLTRKGNTPGCGRTEKVLGLLLLTALKLVVNTTHPNVTYQCGAARSTNFLWQFKIAENKCCWGPFDQGTTQNT